MIKSGNGAYAFPEGFEVEDWERLQKKKTFTVFELACYSLGQCPVSVWDFAFIKESDKTNKEVIKVKRLVGTVKADIQEQVDIDGKTTKLLEVKYRAGVMSPEVRYTRESIDKFFKHYFPELKHPCFYLDHVPVKSELDILKSENKELSHRVKQLSKLVVSFALSVDDRYTVPANKRSIAGLKILMGAINDAEERLNKGKVKQVKLSMTEKTLRDYMLKAFDEIGIEIRA